MTKHDLITSAAYYCVGFGACAMAWLVKVGDIAAAVAMIFGAMTAILTFILNVIRLVNICKAKGK